MQKLYVVTDLKHLTLVYGIVSKSEKLQASVGGVMSYLLGACCLEGAFTGNRPSNLWFFISYCFKTFPVFYLVFQTTVLTLRGLFALIGVTKEIFAPVQRYLLVFNSTRLRFDT